jgi:alanyl-tRNA synthetase
VVDEAMAGSYPELAATRAASEATVRAEEEKFLATVATGSARVQEAIEEAKRAGSRLLAGPTVFRLYDTYGLPIQLLREIAEEERYDIDEVGFEAALATQKERSRAAGGAQRRRKQEIQEALAKDLESEPPTRFAGYVEGPGEAEQKLAVEGVRIVAARRVPGGDGGRDVLAAGDEGVLVFDRTVFYAESGGQVGDVGELRWPGGRAEVIDTQRDGAGHVLHFVRIAEGTLEAPFPYVNLFVSVSHRLPTQRNHTATHLLHAALR